MRWFNELCKDIVVGWNMEFVSQCEMVLRLSAFEWLFLPFQNAGDAWLLRLQCYTAQTNLVSHQGGCCCCKSARFPRETAIQDIPKLMFSLFLRKLMLKFVNAQAHILSPMVIQLGGGTASPWVQEIEIQYRIKTDQLGRQSRDRGNGDAVRRRWRKKDGGDLSHWNYPWKTWTVTTTNGNRWRWRQEVVGWCCYVAVPCKMRKTFSLGRSPCCCGGYLFKASSTSSPPNGGGTPKEVASSCDNDQTANLFYGMSKEEEEEVVVTLSRCCKPAQFLQSVFLRFHVITI